MTDKTASLGPDDGALAAEYAFGLLEGAELDAARKRLASDPAFAAEVVRWQAQFADMAEHEVASVEPPERLRNAVMRKTGMGRIGYGQWIRGTLGGLFGLVVAAMLAFVVLDTGLLEPPTEFESAAVLNAADRRLRIEAGYRAETGTLFLERTLGLPALEGRATELWVIADGSPPFSLGLVPDQPRWRVTVPSLFQGLPLVLALSDEPPGGSPTGAPTGNVLAIEELEEI